MFNGRSSNQRAWSLPIVAVPSITSGLMTSDPSAGEVISAAAGTSGAVDVAGGDPLAEDPPRDAASAGGAVSRRSHIVSPAASTSTATTARVESVAARRRDRVQRGRRFTGRGCAISQASASLLTDEIKGKPIDDVAGFAATDLLDLLGIEISPARLKCAMLSFDSLQHLLDEVGAKPLAAQEAS